MTPAGENLPVGKTFTIKCLQEDANDQFASLDDLLDDIFEPIPGPIAGFITKFFKLDNPKVELLSHLGFDGLARCVRRGALSVRDMVNLVGRSYIQHKNLALVLFVARAMASIIHNQAQAQQHNRLVVGNSSCPVDLHSLPTDVLHNFRRNSQRNYPQAEEERHCWQD